MVAQPLLGLDVRAEELAGVDDDVLELARLIDEHVVDLFDGGTVGHDEIHADQVGRPR